MSDAEQLPKNPAEVDQLAEQAQQEDNNRQGPASPFGMGDTMRSTHPSHDNTTPTNRKSN
jgi:hypothetical protein